MRVLGIETSSPHGSAALMQDGTLVAFEETSEPNAHAESLGTAIERLMARAKWVPTDLDFVAVGRGPGSFTGLRVGIALAQGIATGLGIPIVGIPSLAALAHAVPDAVPGVRLAMIDARRGELFVAGYDREGREVSPATLVPRESIPEHAGSLGAPELVLCGDWADDEAARELQPNWKRVPALRYPNAIATASLAERWLKDGTADARETVTPLYLRDADAVLPSLRPNPLLQAGTESWQVGAGGSEGST